MKELKEEEGKEKSSIKEKIKRETRSRKRREEYY